MLKAMCSNICCIIPGANMRVFLLSMAVVASCFHPFVAIAADSPSEVWVSASANEEEADGSQEHPYTTIQEGVDAVATGGTVYVGEGVYDKGGKIVGGTSTGAQSNRVVITRKVTIIGAGKDKTHIVGCRDPNGDQYGRGANAVRCIYYTYNSSSDYGGMIKGVTLRDGTTTELSVKTGYSGYGGAVGGVNLTTASANRNSKFCLEDCVISNCVAVMGGGLDGVTAVRCLISGNFASSYGSGTRCCSLVNCLVVSNKNTSSSYAALAGGKAVNCTVVGTVGGQGVGRATSAASGEAKIYNCVSFNNAGGDVRTGTTTNNSYKASDDSEMLYDPGNGDYRLKAGSVAVGGGLTEHLSLVTLPEGVNADIDFAGNQIDPEGTGTCDAGCFQGAVSPTVKKVTIEAENGGLAVTGGVVGENVLEPGTAITISESGIGTRPCVGFSVNGTDYLFESTPSITFTAAEVAASERGYAVAAIYSKHWYVDANAADDSGSGFRSATPKKTLAAIMPLTASGDTVHAAAGSYTNGTMVSNSTAGRTVKARVAVKGGVTLVADEGPDVTFIVGESDVDSVSANAYGMGTNAVRCVHLGKDSSIKGFTLTGGRTWWDTSLYTSSTSFGQVDSSYLGGGVCGTSSGYSETYVEDCVISNNCAYFGGAAAFTRLVRCRVFDNKATAGGGAMYKSGAYGSIFNRSRAGTPGAMRSAIYQFYDIVGCTIGPDNRYIDNDSYVRALYSGMSSSDFHHNLVLGTVDGSLSRTVSYCVFANGRDNYPTNETCVVAKSSEVVVDEDLRPIAGQNPAVDAGSLDVISTYAPKLLPYDVDISGEPRVRNGRIDIGALESDPKPWYGKLLDGKGRNITVTAADNMVTNIANGVTLQDGMALSLTWTIGAEGAPRMGHVRVTGGGTLTVTKDGEPYATYTAEDGEVEFSFSPSGRSTVMNFAFAGEGSADVFDFSATVGTLLFIR